MKMFAYGVAAAALMALAAPAHAQAGREGAYVGLGASHYSVDEVDVVGATGRLGYRFHPNFGVEGEASFGIDGDEADILGTPVDIDLENQYGAYAVGFLPVTSNLEVLGRVGWASIDAEGSFGGFTAGASDDGLGLGVGAQYHVNDRFAIRGDYTRLSADGNDDIDGVDTFGLTGIVSF
ncbi:MAG: porin family protein [Hyphomonadaceae bacterium]